MTAKEKADEIVSKFYEYTSSFDNYTSEQCAKICVDEILKVVSYVDGKITIRDKKWSFWNDVKKEIEKL